MTSAPNTAPLRTPPPTFDDLLDPDNETSVVFRTRGRLKEKIQSLPLEYLVPEDELRRRFKFKPKREHTLLRQAFWAEYDRAMRTNSHMEVLAISRGIVFDEPRFYIMLEDPLFVSYMLLPVQSYKILTEGMHNLALKSLYDTINLPHIDEKNKIDHKLLAQKLKIFKMLDDRIKGSVIQRQEIKAISQNFNHNTEIPVRALSPQEIEARIKELEGDLKPANVLLDVIPK